MISNIAWRNIWRNPLRSWVVIGAIATGIWAIVFILAFSQGMMENYIKNSIENNISHIQVHHPQFRDEQTTDLQVNQVEELEQALEKEPSIQAYSKRTLCSAMLATAKSSAAKGVQIRGINPEQEDALTSLKSKIVEGEYFPKKRNPLIIGEALAKKMNLRLRSKVVLTFQDPEGTIVPVSFRVAALFKTGNTNFDESQVFVRQKDIAKFMGTNTATHELAILLKDMEDLPRVKADLAKAFPEQSVEDYTEISPEVALFESQMAMSSIIIIGIVMLALVFGIINTMLMAVLERTRELGMLMAIGMNKGRVFGMILLETLLLGFVATPLGMLLAAVTLQYFSSGGLDLSNYSDGLSKWGMSTVIYPSASASIYLQIAVSVFITAVIGSIYPAFKAVSLRPVEAIRKI